MRMSKQRVILTLFILSICHGIVMAANSPCEDWEPYKDEKCFKVLDKVGTEEEAEKICSQQENNSTLITIHSKDEQDFIFNLLFKIHKVVDTIWIGAKYSNNKFKWTDDSELSFANWGEGSPTNTPDKACVQMIPESSSMGKWVDEPCNKNNKVVCQKMQTWSLSRLQKTLLDARKKLEDSYENVTKQLNNQQSIITEQQTTINNLKQNPVPIGFIYVQLPSQPEPKTLWSTVEWKDVTSEYAGIFFRAEGGASAEFGEIQEENSPRLTEVNASGGSGQYHIGIVPGQWSDKIQSANTGFGSGYYYYLRFYVTSGEVRPRNKAMRIWKRTS